jgi:flagellar hook protein FlgE
MLSSLDIGVSALEQFQESMDVIGNNIANENTVGYKDATTNFEDTLSQTLQSGGFSGATSQVGTGVTTSGISTDFSDGTIDQTGVSSDLAISGNGFFVVSDPSTGAKYLTRAGNFQVDPNGYLVTQQGMRVQGYTNSGLTTVGDIQVNNSGAPNGDTAAVASYSFGSDGTLTISLADGTSYTGGQVLLQNVTSPETLLKQGQNLYGNSTAAGALKAAVAPGTSGTGTIVGGSLEASNVDLASEFANLITAQRGFEAGSKIVTTSDEVLQDLVNLKR